MADITHQAIADAFAGLAAVEDRERRALSEKHDEARAALRAECGKLGHVFRLSAADYAGWRRACVICAECEPATADAGPVASAVFYDTRR